MPIPRAPIGMRRLQLLLIALGIAGCGRDVRTDAVELGGNEAPLSEACAYDGKQRRLTITIEGGEQLTLSRRKDGLMLANGEPCADAKAASVKAIVITENSFAPGDQDIVLDFTLGRFGVGTVQGPGILLELGSGNDIVSLRMGTTADKVSFGAAGIALNADAYLDLVVTSDGSVSYGVMLGAGNDTFTGQGSSKKDTPFMGSVLVQGGEGNDKITGGDGNDELYGGPGNDWLKGGLGDDLCAGDEGDDIFDESRPADLSNGNDTYQDSGGTKDKLDYSSRTTPLVIDIEPATGGTNDDGEVELGEADQVDPGIDILLGGKSDDILSGDSGNNTISGGTGDDVLAGGDGKDVLNGDAGNDTFKEGDVANGPDTFKGGVGIDTISYADRLLGVTITMDGRSVSGERASSEGDSIANDIENCSGGAGDDDITGSSLDNVIIGGAGADTLRGGAGADRFDEGDAANGGDVFIGGAGFDTLDYSMRWLTLMITMDGNAADDGELGEHDMVSGDIEECRGGGGSDTIVGGPRADLISGGDGDDTLRGGAGNDELAGDGGDDRLEGEAGHDTLDGGDHYGGDTLDCGSGDDIGFNGESLVDCEI